MHPEFGQALRRARKAKGLTGSQLAAAIGVHTSAISRWERGDNAPELLHLRRLVSVLTISPTEAHTWEGWWLAAQEKVRASGVAPGVAPGFPGADRSDAAPDRGGDGALVSRPAVAATSDRLSLGPRPQGLPLDRYVTKAEFDDFRDEIRMRLGTPRSDKMYSVIGPPACNARSIGPAHPIIGNLDMRKLAHGRGVASSARPHARWAAGAVYATVGSLHG